MRILHWEDCLNVRDIGGYPTANGRQTRFRALVRADGLHQLTEDSLEALVDYGIHTVIDLRYREEIKRLPNPFARPEAHNGKITYLNMPPLDVPDEVFETAVQEAGSMEERYFMAFDYGQRQIADISTAIAEAKGGVVLVHCHAGRDRTGRLVALLLALAGVPPETIVKDYAFSDTCLQPLYQKLMKTERDPAARDALARQIAEAPQMMHNVLDYLDRRYGGAEGYLRTGGIGEESLEKLKRRLVES